MDWSEYYYTSPRRLIPPEQLALFERPETPVPEDLNISLSTTAAILADLLDMTLAWGAHDESFSLSWLTTRAPHTPLVLVETTTNSMIILGPAAPPRTFADELVAYDEKRFLLWDPNSTNPVTLVRFMEKIERKFPFKNAFQDDMRLPLGKRGLASPLWLERIRTIRTRTVRVWTEMQEPGTFTAIFGQPSNDN